jgi:hypothetical protein
VIPSVGEEERSSIEVRRLPDAVGSPHRQPAPSPRRSQDEAPWTKARRLPGGLRPMRRVS